MEPQIFVLKTLIIVLCWTQTLSHTLEVPECEPPDFPRWGGYGPRQDFYLAGDVIHYYCDVDTYIGGNFHRRCEDTGSWSGDAPVCDKPSKISSTNQTSTQDPPEENGAARAADGIRGTCAVTSAGGSSTWFGTLATPGELIRVMVFLPKDVDVSYEVMLVRRDGEEFSCGSKRGRIHHLEWHFHNCPGPNNRDAVAIKVRSMSSLPLQLCEVVAHVLTSPVCTDPHFSIMNGRLQLTRKVATLVCDARYTRSPDKQLECIRDGVWNRKSLYCMEKQWEGHKEQSEFDP